MRTSDLGITENVDKMLWLHAKETGWKVAALVSWKKASEQGVKLMNVNTGRKPKCHIIYIFLV